MTIYSARVQRRDLGSSHLRAASDPIASERCHAAAWLYREWFYSACRVHWHQFSPVGWRAQQRCPQRLLSTDPAPMRDRRYIVAGPLLLKVDRFKFGHGSGSKIASGLLIRCRCSLGRGTSDAGWRHKERERRRVGGRWTGAISTMLNIDFEAAVAARQWLLIAEWQSVRPVRSRATRAGQGLLANGSDANR